MMFVPTVSPRHPARVPSGLMAAVLCAVLSACGGGSDAPPPAVRDRIEPLDTSAIGQAKSAAVELSPWPWGSAPAPVVRLAPLPAAQQAPQAPASAGKAQRIGVARSVTATDTVAKTAALLQWQRLDDGAQVAALEFESPGAHGVRLGVQVHALPPGAWLQFRGEDAAAEAVQISVQELHALVQRPQAGAVRTFWSPGFGQERTLLQVRIPADADPAQVQLAVAQLAHTTGAAQAAPAAPAAPAPGTAKLQAGVCEVDVACHAQYLPTSRAVVRMEYIDQGIPYHCTGTLLNDAQNSQTPYLLTAQHCMANQAQAETLMTEWFVRAQACGSGTTASQQRRWRGATLLQSWAPTDAALLRLNDVPPVGALFAGSYFGTPLAQETALASLHHPAADWQKISLGRLDAFLSCKEGSFGSDCVPASTEQANTLRLTWSQGVTEHGSSGAPAFAALGGQHYVVGQLSGGFSSCAQPAQPDFYGRFDTTYRAVLQQWLGQ